MENKKALVNGGYPLHTFQQVEDIYMLYISSTEEKKRIVEAYDFIMQKHKNQFRKSGEPYYHHLIEVAYILASLQSGPNTIIAGLLHDVVEDCGKTLEELPVNDETKELVRLLTREKAPIQKRDEINEEYYLRIIKNPKAALIKCMDRCNNLTTMSWGLSRDRIYRMIKETEEYYPRLIEVIKATPEYNNAAWLLKYQIESMLDIYKRLM